MLLICFICVVIAREKKKKGCKRRHPPKIFKVLELDASFIKVVFMETEKKELYIVWY